MHRVGRYVLENKLASGGMGTVFLGRLAAPARPSSRVAIKRPHDAFVSEPRARERFLREARIAARIHHPNVVRTLDVVEDDGELLYIIMEYVEGASLSRLRSLSVEKGQPLPIGIVLRILVDILEGLHAAHEARSENGAPLGVVHRDVSPENVLVGLDGIARVSDFGIAKTATQFGTEGTGLKGKVRYVAPEQIRNEPVSRGTDIYSACVVAWELLAGEPLFFGDSEAAILARVLEGKVRRLVSPLGDVPAEIEQLLARGLRASPGERPSNAADLAAELERSGLPASRAHVGSFVDALAGDAIRSRWTGTLAARSDRETASIRAPSEMLTEREAARGRTGHQLRQALSIVTIGLVCLIMAGGVWHWRRTRAAGPAFELRSTPLPSASVSEEMPPPPMAVATLSPPPAAVSSTPSALDARPPATAPAKRPSATPKTKKADCEVPYMVDERGIRRIRKECL
jgi:eukaryotic-like serine/threonine-protein kinase